MTALAKRMGRMQRSTIREILKITQRPEIISFAGGLPAPELFPLQEFSDSTQQALKEFGPSALQYDLTEGYRPLKEFICQWIVGRGIRATPDHIMLTNGSQQALDLIGKIFLDPGDTVLVEDPTYLGAIQAFNAYECSYRPVPMDQDGIQIDELERALKERMPKFAYLVPTFQNPSGITMTRQRREEFLQRASQHSLPIVEDDPYGMLRFKGQPAPSLYELAGGKNVIYLSTFSKVLSPGIRLGFVVAEPPIITSLVLAKQAADLQPNTLIQRATYCYAKNGHLDRHLPIIIDAYKHRAERMLDAMKRHFPKNVSWIDPEGGMFIWVTLPKGVSATRLFDRAIAHQVAFVNGTVFHAGGGGDNTLRLNFTNSKDEQIDTGIKRLADALNETIAESAKRSTNV